MFRNNLKIAIRNFSKQKVFTLINITGLAIGLTACILILLWVQDEISYDRFHEKADRIYIVGLDIKLGNQDLKAGATPPPMAFALLDEFNGIEQAARFQGAGEPVVRYGDRIFKDENAFFVDSTFFEIFTFPMLEGDPETALDRPNTVVITESMKTKYFGKEDPMGETIRINGREDFEVTGVCADPPSNTLFRFNFLFSAGTLPRPTADQWGSNNLQTFILLKEGASPENINAQFPALLEKYFGPIIRQIMNISLDEFYAGGNRYYYYLEALEDIHLNSSFTEGFEGTTDKTYVYILSVIAIFILFIACINFVNLSTARSSQRSREVGIKKVVGSSRGRLIQQFLTESMILSIVAMLLSIGLVELLMGSFNDLTQKELVLDYTGNPLLLPALLVLTLFIGGVAGSYTALFQSSVRVLSVLKGEFSFGMKTGRLRNILVIFQFTISIFLIICTLTAFSQVHYFRNLDMGFRKEQILVVENCRALGEKQQVFKTEVLKNPGIEAASLSVNVPTQGFSGNGILKEGGASSEVHILSRWWADYDILETMGLQMEEGRFYSPEFPTDSQAIVINQVAIRSMELSDPLKQRLIEPSDTNQFRPIIGILQDFNYQPLQNPIRPLSIELMYRGMNPQFLLARVRPGEYERSILAIKKVWEDLVPDQPFEYFFMDDAFEEAYASESKLGVIYTIFAILAIFIACLGLFGMASFTTEQKTREIAVRKAMGASVGQVVLLLGKEFNRWVILANLIAWPLGFYIMKNWLENFAFRIDFGFNFYTLLLFLGATILTLLLALLTIIWQSVSAALKNPAESLKYE